ncbi:MAG: SDR family NAD(P)-dependent oxidoreductase [Bacteroidota bacterium]
MENKKIVIVGGTDGIGRALANCLVTKNKVLIIGRSDEKGKYFVAENGGNANYLTTDLSILKNIPPLVEKIKLHFEEVDFIVHTADILRSKRLATTEGIEITIAIKFYSRILFNQLMIGEEKAYQPDRIIHVAAPCYAPKNFMKNFPFPADAGSFEAHKVGQISNEFYGLLMKRKLATRNIKINILNPDFVSTNIHKNGELNKLVKFLYPLVARLFVGKSKTPEEYAKIPFSILKNENKDANEFTFINAKGKRIEENKHVRDVMTQKKLYEFAKEKIDRTLQNHSIKSWL